MQWSHDVEHTTLVIYCGVVTVRLNTHCKAVSSRVVIAVEWIPRAHERAYGECCLILGTTAPSTVVDVLVFSSCQMQGARMAYQSHAKKFISRFVTSQCRFSAPRYALSADFCPPLRKFVLCGRSVLCLLTSHAFFGPGNNGGAVLPVGETRRSADFYVSADLTRPSERRLQAEKKMRFEELRSRAEASG